MMQWHRNWDSIRNTHRDVLVSSDVTLPNTKTFIWTVWHSSLHGCRDISHCKLADGWSSAYTAHTILIVQDGRRQPLRARVWIMLRTSVCGMLPSNSLLQCPSKYYMFQFHLQNRNACKITVILHDYYNKKLQSLCLNYLFFVYSESFNSSDYAG
jgi:hypothetical protein